MISRLFRRSFAAALLCLSAPLALQAQPAVWEHTADFTQTRAMVFQDGLLWGASSRGGWSFDPQQETWEHYSITGDMVSLDQACVTGDGEGWIFWAGADASLSGRSSLDESWSRGFLEFREHPQIVSINHLQGGDGRVIVSHDQGLSVFRLLADRDEYLVEGNHRQFGTLPAGVSALASEIVGNRLYVLTSAGLAVASDWPELSGLFDVIPLQGLPGQVESGFLAARPDGVIQLLLNDGQGNGYHALGQVDGSWNALEQQAGVMYTALAAGEDDFAIARSNRIITLAQIDTVRFDGSTCAALHYSEGVLWAALGPETADGGLLRADRNAGTLDLFRPDVPGAESFVDLDLAPDGSLWLAGVAEQTQRNGLYQLRDGEWKSHRFAFDRIGNYPTSVLCDSEGGVWAGTWGRGLLYYDVAADTSWNYRNSSEPGQRVYGFNPGGNDENFELVSDVDEDERGNIWFVNHRSYVDSFLVAIPSTWQMDHATPFHRAHYSRHVAGDRDSYPYFIESVSRNEVWMGVGGKETGDTDKAVVQYRPTGSNSSLELLREWNEAIVTLSDPIYNFGSTEQDAAGLVTGLAVDPEGAVWVSTENGIYYSSLFSSSPESFFRIQFVPGLISENASTLTSDSRGRVWIASERGINVYNPVVIAFEEPGYVQDFNRMFAAQDNISINRMRFDEQSGMLYLATSAGLFSVQTPLQNHGSSPAGDTALYPNPFRPETHERVYIESSSLANSSETEVSVYNLEGILLRRLSLSEAEDGWDGRDDSGDLVPTGVYLILVSSDNGSGSGKLAVIRE